MKKNVRSIAVFVLVVFSLSACKDKEMEREVQQLREQNEKLTAQSTEQDSALSDLMETFNEIGQNLADIREKEASIELSAESGDKGAKERIKEDIQIINDLMQKNREKLEELDNKLKVAYSSNSKLKASMEKLKAEFTAQIEEKDGQIALLKEDLEKLNYTVQELNTEIDQLTARNEEKLMAINQKDSVIGFQTEEINTGYYTLGSKKELIKDEIVVREGGFIGIGATPQLNDKIKIDKFNRIDITEVQSIPLSGKKAELVTVHPEGSYKIEAQGKNEVTGLVITDPKSFWTSSKYLVVMVD